MKLKFIFFQLEFCLKLKNEIVKIYNCNKNIQISRGKLAYQIIFCREDTDRKYTAVQKQPGTTQEIKIQIAEDFSNNLQLVSSN